MQVLFVLVHPARSPEKRPQGWRIPVESGATMPWWLWGCWHSAGSCFARSYRKWWKGGVGWRWQATFGIGKVPSSDHTHTFPPQSSGFRVGWKKYDLLHKNVQIRTQKVMWRNSWKENFKGYLIALVMGNGMKVCIMVTVRDSTARSIHSIMCFLFPKR